MSKKSETTYPNIAVWITLLLAAFIVIWICISVLYIFKEEIIEIIETQTVDSTAIAPSTTETLTPEIVVTAAPTQSDAGKEAFTDLEKTINYINSGGQIVYAYSFESKPYTYNKDSNNNPVIRIEEGVPAGFEIDLINEIARRWFETTQGSFVRYPIYAKDRVIKAGNGDSAFVVGAVSPNAKRCNPDDPESTKTICTDPDIKYIQDKTYALIKIKYTNPEFPTFATLCSNSASIKVILLPNTIAGEDYTSEEYKEKITNELKEKYGSSCNPAPDFRDTRDVAINYLLNLSDISVYITDGSILRAYSANNFETTYIPEGVDGDPWGSYVVLMSKNYSGLKKLMDFTFKAMICDNTIYNIYKDSPEKSYFEPGGFSISWKDQAAVDSCNAELRKNIKENSGASNIEDIWSFIH